DIAAGNVLIPDTKSREKLVGQLLLGPLGPEPTLAPAVLAAIKPADVSVEVLNGSGERGAARKFADELAAKGYVVSKVGNADSYGYTKTEIHEHSKVFGVGERVRSDVAVLPDVTVTAEPAPSPATSDVTVIVGKDFLATLETRASSGPSASSAAK
ncbi:MAG: LytR C-terminal domain-containing protein, partial [Candidatus Eremiobacteraeota bacterium]|nr:LytR C-terminal domain-containing protein [Candidatus Eremiobacteraeota bacterium]